MPLDKIRSQQTDFLFQYIADFPKDSYVHHYVRGQGHCYIDEVNDYIKNLLRAGISWEGDLAKLMREKIPLGSTVIEIGAHIGTHTASLSQFVGPSGRVIAFEPQPKLFCELFMNMALNGVTNVEFFWAGVGDQCGKVELGVLVEENEGGTGACVDLVTLDSLQLERVSLIKIDVEGMEKKVIEGARQTILRNKPASFIEILGGVDFTQATRQRHLQIQQVIQKLQGLNYQVYHLETHNYLALPQLSGASPTFEGQYSSRSPG